MGQALPCLGQKPLGIGAEILQIQTHLGQVCLVLGSGIGAKANRVAKIIMGKTRHDRVQVDHTNGFAGGGVKQHIIQLGIIMGHPQGQLTGSRQVAKPMGVRLAVLYELNFRLHSGGTTGLVGFYRREKLVLIPPQGVVEIRNRLIQSLSRKIRQQVLEPAECLAALLEQSCALHRVIADRVLYKHIGAEVVPIRCSVILGTILGLDKVQGLPVRVAAGSPNLLLQKGSDCKHILHQPVNVTKYIVIDLLQHVALLTALRQIGGNDIGCIDMAVAKGPAIRRLALKIKAVDHLLNTLHTRVLPYSCAYAQNVLLFYTIMPSFSIPKIKTVPTMPVDTVLLSLYKF